MQTDFLVIGSGIAGLTYALKVAQHCPDKSITIISKRDKDESNTKYAQGGVAGVINFADDSFQKHIDDTLIAGDGLCNSNVVKIVVEEGVERIKEMVEWGVNFDKNSEGEFVLGKEGGHSEFRILHHKDVTGREIESRLLQAVSLKKNIQLIDHCFVIDLITQHHKGYLVTKSATEIECYGVYVLNALSNRVEKVLAKTIMLATGGIGHIYRTSTNPSIATGDGVAMVYRAKGRIENMEFIQFHPTALYTPNSNGQAFLITEAVRGDGGILRNHSGEAFMRRYDERADLAPRDIVARAIDHEMKVNGTESVFLDCTHMDKEKFLVHFPNIYEKCQSVGIDVFEDYIPVAPAAHYSCGGIKADEWGRTSILNLYACGECASTGLHGANRLASNSLLEAMVFAHRSAEDAVKTQGSAKFAEAIPDWKTRGTQQPREMILITQSLKELQLIMTDYVGIVRSDIRLERAMNRLDLLHDETEKLYNSTVVSPQLCELRNMITVGYLIVKSAQFRKESRGLHYTTDYPQKSELLQNLVW